MKKPRIVFQDLIFTCLFILLALASVFSFTRIHQLTESSNWVDHTRQVEGKLLEVMLTLANAETGQRGYLLTGDSSYLETLKGRLELMEYKIRQLDSLTEDDGTQHQKVGQLAVMVKSRFRMLDEVLRVNKDKVTSIPDMQGALKEGKELMIEIREQVADMLKNERALLAHRLKIKDHNVFFTPFYSLLLSILAILILTVTYFKMRREILLRVKAQEAEANAQVMQAATLKSELLFRNIADSVPVLIWMSEANAQRNFFNKGWLAFTGKTAAIEKGKGWMEGIHPDDMERVLERQQYYFRKQEAFYLEYRLKRNDGQYRWISDKAEPRFNTAGAFIGYTGGCMDIQEQKGFAKELEIKVAERTYQLNELNEQLKIQNSIFAHAEENALTGSYSWSVLTGEMEYSDNLFRMFGYKPQEFVPSFEIFLGFIHPEDKEQVIKDSRETFEKRQLVEHLYRIITKQDKIKYFRSSGTFTGEEDNLYLVGSIQDVTKDTLMNEMLVEKNVELERRYAELESFSFIASHDLQEPLRKIQTFGKLIINRELENLSEKGQDYFSRMVSAASRMQNLIEALLSYSSTNVPSTNFVPTDLNQVMDEVEVNLKEMIEERNAVIEREILPNINVVSLQFYQLFTNLVTNAIKYSKKDLPARIIIKATIVSGEQLEAESLHKKKFWNISFSDNGIGFDKQFEQKIFELFQRLHSKQEYEGTGIGLSICKKIVQNHHGYITAKGKVGEGAVFNIYLPILN